MNFNYEAVDKDNRTYVFVTRGRSKRIDKKEIQSFFEEYKTETKEIQYVFNIPNDRARQVMFAKDIRIGGLKFCMHKYGVSRADIIREAKRLVPEVNWEAR